jgi:hypothetical protein
MGGRRAAPPPAAAGGGRDPAQPSSGSRAPRRSRLSRRRPSGTRGEAKPDTPAFIANRLILVNTLIFIQTILLSTKKMLFMVSLIVSLSHPKYFQKNFEKMIQILLDNNYLLDFIFSSINNRLKKLFNKTKDDSNNNKNSFFTIPYMEEISNGFTQITKKHKFKIAFRCCNKLNKFIRTDKDSLNHMKLSDVMYKISCLECDATYIGQTKKNWEQEYANTNKTL